MPSTTNRKFKFSLNQSDSERLKDIATKLGMTESDVLRRGLKLMSLYASTEKDEKIKITIQNQEGDSKEVLVI